MGKFNKTQTDLAVVIQPSSQLQQATELTGQDVKQYLCPLATEPEIFIFLKTCQAMNLNPFGNGEVYLIKYSTSEKAQIVVGYKAHLKRADATRLVEYWYLETADDLSECTYVCKRKDWTKEFRWTVYREELKEPTSPKSPLYKKPRTQLQKTAIARGASLLFPNDVGTLPYIPEELPNIAETTSSDMQNGASVIDMSQNGGANMSEDIINIQPSKLDDLETPNAVTEEPEADPTTTDNQAVIAQKSCFATATKLGMTDAEIKADCCKLFYKIVDGNSTETKITSRKQMTGMQWQAYREILDQRINIQTIINNVINAGIEKQALEDYLCVRFLHGSISDVIFSIPSTIENMLKETITLNKMPKLTAAAALIQKWFNLKSVGREEA